MSCFKVLYCCGHIAQNTQSEHDQRLLNINTPDPDTPQLRASTTYLQQIRNMLRNCIRRIANHNNTQSDIDQFISIMHNPTALEEHCACNFKLERHKFIRNKLQKFITESPKQATIAEDVESLSNTSLRRSQESLASYLTHESNHSYNLGNEVTYDSVEESLYSETYSPISSASYHTEAVTEQPRALLLKPSTSSAKEEAPAP